jgi:hypothetical protein
MHFHPAENIELLHDRKVLFFYQGLDGFHSGADIGKASLFSFDNPLFRVAVTVEDDSLMVLYDFQDDLLYFCVEVFCLFQPAGNLA